jgi:hypothetical protein
MREYEHFCPLGYHFKAESAGFNVQMDYYGMEVFLYRKDAFERVFLPSSCEGSERIFLNVLAIMHFFPVDE